MHMHHMPHRRHLIQPCFSPTRQLHLRLPRLEITNRHIPPGDPHPQASAKCFGAGFFRRPALGISAGLILASAGLALFIFGEDTIAKPVTKPLKRGGNTVNIRQIRSDP